VNSIPAVNSKVECNECFPMDRIKCRSQRLEPEKMQPSARSCSLLLLLLIAVVTAGNKFDMSARNSKLLVRESPAFCIDESAEKQKAARNNIVSFVVVSVRENRLPFSAGFKGGFGVEKEVH